MKGTLQVCLAQAPEGLVRIVALDTVTGRFGRVIRATHPSIGIALLRYHICMLLIASAAARPRAAFGVLPLLKTGPVRCFKKLQMLLMYLESAPVCSILGPVSIVALFALLPGKKATR